MNRPIAGAVLILNLSCGAARGEDLSDVAIVDTHIHFYDVNRPEGVPWPPKSDTVLNRPILPKDFDAVAEKNGIGAAAIVEASPWEKDNRWILDLVKHYPDRYIGFVGNLPVGTPEFAVALRDLSQDERFVGVRLRTRPRGDQDFTDASWRDLRLFG